MSGNADYVWRYHNDPTFHAQVHVGTRAVIDRWQKKSPVKESPDDRMWAEAKRVAFAVVKALYEARASVGVSPSEPEEGT